ncbi:hypothetical protein [uncultured Eubacterium sp.]|uniref:hypothetical protein n=1 Tax=uncultured Eubacterium sp. TaxID=165185 RepID=UPI0026728B4F|nr:hypothetical protein [uncultured Eubacterium sp.]
MNNRHLYKAKRVRGGKWIEGTYTHGFEYKSIGGVTTFIENHCITAKNGYICEIDPITLCQGTGREDEWENDVFEYDEKRYIIVYSAEEAMWVAVTPLPWDDGNVALSKISEKYYKKLGNAIDNPELLKVERENNKKGRLLDERAVIKAVRKHTNKYGALDNDISNILKEITAAYDVDKVTEQISNSGFYMQAGRSQGKSMFCKILSDYRRKIINIVEEGGVK